ncbi:MAG: hypothetical protein LBR80_11005 [Deltaproteobacteria bacterium]|jgi:hypothetical protein|nr:hypothetical protein [Deltaproteobacteria bacterium]
MRSLAMLATAALAALAAQPAALAFDYGSWTDFYSQDDPKLEGLGISFKVPPSFVRQQPPGKDAAESWARNDPATGVLTAVTFQALFDAEGDLSRAHRTITGTWDEDSLEAFWQETLSPMDGYRSHEGTRHRGWPAALTSIAARIASDDGSATYEEAEMLMVMHENVMLVMQCYDSSPTPQKGHDATVDGICRPFFDSLEIEGEAPGSPPLPR